MPRMVENQGKEDKLRLTDKPATFMMLLISLSLQRIIVLLNGNWTYMRMKMMGQQLLLLQTIKKALWKVEIMQKEGRL